MENVIVASFDPTIFGRNPLSDLVSHKTVPWKTVVRDYPRLCTFYKKCKVPVVLTTSANIRKYLRAGAFPRQEAVYYDPFTRYFQIPTIAKEKYLEKFTNVVNREPTDQELVNFFRRCLNLAATNYSRKTTHAHQHRARLLEAEEKEPASEDEPMDQTPAPQPSTSTQTQTEEEKEPLAQTSFVGISDKLILPPITPEYKRDIFGEKYTTEKCTHELARMIDRMELIDVLGLDLDTASLAAINKIIAGESISGFDCMRVLYVTKPLWKKANEAELIEALTLLSLGHPKSMETD